MMQKKYLFALRLFILCISFIPYCAFSVGSADYTYNIDEKYNIATEFVDRHLQSLVKGEVIDFSDLVYDSDDIYSYSRYLEWRVQKAKQLRTTYSDYYFEIHNFSLDSSGTKATGIIDVSYTYASGAGEGGYWGCIMEFEFVDKEDGPKISAFYLEEELFEYYFDNIQIYLSEGYSLKDSHKKMLESEEVNPMETLVSSEFDEMVMHDHTFSSYFFLILLVFLIVLFFIRRYKPDRKKH